MRMPHSSLSKRRGSLSWVAAGRLEPQCACSAQCAFEGLWHAAEGSDPLQFRRSDVCGRRAPRERDRHIRYGVYPCRWPGRPACERRAAPIAAQLFLLGAQLQRASLCRRCSGPT